MRKDIPIGQIGEINGVKVKAVAPENYIDLCHGCHFDDIDGGTECKANRTQICRLPDRIFKLIIE